MLSLMGWWELKLQPSNAESHLVEEAHAKDRQLHMAFTLYCVFAARWSEFKYIYWCSLFVT